MSHRRRRNPLALDSNTKLALYAGAGLVGVGVLAYVLTSQAQTAQNAALIAQNNGPAPGSYTPSPGVHAANVPKGSTLVVNAPAGASNLVLTAGNSSVATAGANTITGVASGQTAISISYTDSTGATQRDALTVTVP